MATHTYTSEEFIEAALLWRGIEPGRACDRCGGAGTRAYGSTSTWRGGIGGQMITNGVCDKCWGSGDKDRPWPSHDGMESNAIQLTYCQEKHRELLSERVKLKE